MNRIEKVKNILFYDRGGAMGEQGVGGSLVSLLQLVRSLDPNRFKPVIVLLEPFDICGEYRKAGCKVIILDGFLSMGAGVKSASSKGSFAKKIPKPRWLTECKVIAHSRSKFQALKKIIQTENIDIVHCNNGLDFNLEALLSALVCSKTCICHARAYGSEAISPIFRLLGRKAHKHLAISTSIGADLAHKGLPEKDIVLFHNWIDTRQVPRLQAHPQVYSMNLPFQVVCMGRFIPWKGQQLLIDAARDLKALGYSFQIRFYGDAGSEKNRFYLENAKRSVVDFGLEAQVLFEGYRSYQEIFQTPCHLLVHTSIKPEPFGRVIIEGMYNSIPVIGSGLGGVLDIIRDGENGLLFDPTVPGDLVNKIVRLINDNELRVNLGSKGYSTVLEHFSETGKREKLSEIYSA